MREGQFINPTGIAVDASGNVYVSEFGHHDSQGGYRIQKFTSNGVFITGWAVSEATGDGSTAWAMWQ